MLSEMLLLRGLLHLLRGASLWRVQRCVLEVRLSGMSYVLSEVLLIRVL